MLQLNADAIKQIKSDLTKLDLVERNADGSPTQHKKFIVKGDGASYLSVILGDSGINSQCIFLETHANGTVVKFSRFEPELGDMDADSLRKIIEIINRAIPGVQEIYETYLNSPDRTSDWIAESRESLIAAACERAAHDNDRYKRLKASLPFPSTDPDEYALPLNPDDPVRDLLSRVHDACEPLSLIPGSETDGDQIASDYGYDLLLRALGREDNYYLDNFDTKAKFSALALRLAWLRQDVIKLPSDSAWNLDPPGTGNIGALPYGTEKYYGFNRERDSQKKCIALLKNQPGVFESSMSRKVVSDLRTIDQELDSLLSILVEHELLEEPDRTSFLKWWRETYFGAINKAVEEAEDTCKKSNEKLDSLARLLMEESRKTHYQG